MICCVGIDGAKDKHDYFILSSEGKVPTDVFTIPNGTVSFQPLRERIQTHLVSQSIPVP